MKLAPGVLIKINMVVSIFRVLISQSRKLAQQYFLQYQEQIPTAQIVHKVAAVMQEYTQSG